MNSCDYSKKRRFLSSKLIEAREQAGFSQKQVSDRKIVSQSELSKLENGARRVDFLLLLELARLYNQSITFFIPFCSSINMPCKSDTSYMILTFLKKKIL